MKTLNTAGASSSRPDLKRLDRLLTVQSVCFVIAGAIATVILCGWLVPAIGAALPGGWRLMKANTALAVLLCIASLLLTQPERRKPRVIEGLICAGIVVLLAGTALFGHLSGRTFVLDTILNADSGAEMPGRMSIQSSLYFILLGLTLVFERMWQKRPHIIDALSIALVLIIMVIFAGYFFGATNLFGQSPYTRTSPQTLVCMAMLIFAVIVRRTWLGSFSLFVGTGVGSHIARNILPFALPLPFLVVGGSAYTMAKGWLSAPYAVALTASVTSILLLVLVMLMARKINDAMEALIETEEQNRLLLYSVGEGIYGLDLNGNATFANPAACRMLGYEAEQILGQPMHALIHHHYPDGSSYPIEKCPMAAALADGQVHREEEEVFWREDGSCFPIEYTSTPLVKDGVRVGAVVIFNDVTERKKVARMKDEFISTVSHELRTPLTSIKGSLGLVVSGKLGDLSETAMQMLTIAYENSNRLESLINDLLDINKIQWADTLFQMEPIHINSLISKALHSTQGYADKYGIQCFWQPSEHDNVCILGDENRLIQVLSNLLSNAIKYSGKDTRVTIATNHDNKEVRVSITDSGPGIPLGFQHKVFEKFSQADSSDTRQKGGTGLGLAITKEIVEKHGGRIGFNSIPGHGATFYFELPIAKPAEPSIVE